VHDSVRKLSKQFKLSRDDFRKMSMEPCMSTGEESTIVGSLDSADLKQSAIFDTCAFDQNGWEDFHLKVVHGVDKIFRVTIESKYFSIHSDVYAVAGRRISVADYLLRKFRATVEMAVSSGTYVRILSPSIDQYILKRSCINISANNGNVCIDFNVLIDNPDEEFQHLKKSLSALILQWISCSNIDAPEARAHWQNSEDQNALRKMVSIVGVSFVADGSILPRAGMNVWCVYSHQIRCIRSMLNEEIVELITRYSD
jgi:Predicted ATPase of the ABC class